MGAGHSHGHAGANHGWRLRAAFVIIGLFFLAELAGGLISGSLALLTDAGHMGADVVTLGAALTATMIAARSGPSGRRTYGSYRVEVFAAGLAVLLMIGVSVYVVIEAVGRIGQDAVVQTGPMLIVGALGLCANIAALLLLRGGAGESINVKGAYLEVVADTAGSIGVLVAGVLISITGNVLWDTLVAFGIGVFILVRAAALGKQVFAILAQHTPEGIDADKVSADLLAVPGVCDVHDLHLWTLTSGMNVATAHLVADEDSHDVLDNAQRILSAAHGIEHATLQIEPTEHQDCEPPRSW